jgi:hypothetical protein
MPLIDHQKQGDTHALALGGWTLSTKPGGTAQDSAFLGTPP